VDQLLEAAVADEDLDAERIHSIANWLATGAADREPINVLLHCWEFVTAAMIAIFC
jgi:hypothetical protein